MTPLAILPTRLQPQPRFGADKISVDDDGTWHVPDHVRIPVVPGDGIGLEITHEAQRVVDEVVKKTYGDERSIEWVPLVAGEQALAQTGELLPEETVKTVEDHHILAKGPLGTPTGGGFRSINVQLRQIFHLFANVRPVRKLPGVQSPLKNDNVDVVIFRENTEDVYAGIEAEKGSEFAAALRQTVAKENGAFIPEDSGIGVKPISESASKRIMRTALDYAIHNHRRMITIVHKGNIQKFTEGAFLNWCKDVAQTEYGDQTVMWDDFLKDYKGDFKNVPKGKIVIRDRIADAQFQDVLLAPDKHDVIVTMNLNGDYLSDAYAGSVGGLGLAPAENLGDNVAIFEAVHGTAPDIAGQNKANPTAMFLSMVLMLHHLGWDEAADKLTAAIENTLSQGKVTADLLTKRTFDVKAADLLGRLGLRNTARRVTEAVRRWLENHPQLKPLSRLLPNLRQPLSTTAYTSAVINNIA